MNLADILQSALGDAFVIERELSGGGMSRVFLAREPRLDRSVVIKVLPPQLAAGVPADRFEREIKLAAGLQHPHIVPVLTAGSAGELLYYVMPHVAGESVAQRLELDGPLPVTEAARMLRDVADALAYAHSRGVVHRDIKPANVLLSGDHGMVTDFGVAKALGDPGTDTRADIYAFGVLAYEALTGELPGARTATPPVLPPAMSDLVMRCLAEDPAARPQSAAQLVTELEAITASSGDVPVKKRLGMPLITVIAVSVLVAITLIIAIFRGGTSPTNVDPNLVAILPFRVAGADSSLHYLREGIMDLLAAKLTGEGGPRAADPQSVMSAWRRSGGTESEDLSQEAALALASHLGAGELLTGSVVGSGNQITITASLVNASDGSIKAQSDVVGSGDSVPALVDRLAGQLLVRTASLDEALATSSIGALRAYLAGRAAYRRGSYAIAAEHLQRALLQDSTLTQAALLLVCAQTWGAPVPNLERVRRLAWDGRERLNARERALLEAFLGPRFPEPPLHSEILALAERAVDLGRDNPDTWYLFGDHFFHDGAYLGFEDWAERARAALERALSFDSAFADPLGHLVELAGWRGDTADMRRLAALFLATDGSRRGGYAAAVRWHIGHVLRDTALATEAIHALDTVPVLPLTMMLTALRYGAHDDVARMLDALGRRATTRPERLELNTQRVTVLINQGRVREAVAVADLHPLRVQAAIYSGVNDSVQTAASVRELARVAAGPAPRNEAALTEQLSTVTLLGQWALVGGDAVGATRAAARLRAAPAQPVRVARYTAVWAELLEGHAAAIRGAAEARAHADRADSLLLLGPDAWRPAMENLVLALLYDALGDSHRALAAVRRRSPQGLNFLESWFLREEGQLAAKAGDRPGAVAAYQGYLTMLSDPDLEIAGIAEAVKREIARLDR